MGHSAAEFIVITVVIVVIIIFDYLLITSNKLITK